MSSTDLFEGLPTYKGKRMVSLLFLLTSDTCTVDDDAVVVPLDAAMIVFSDRPHRIARTINGGVSAFAAFYSHSNFETDPPNVTFAASTVQDDAGVCSVLELGQPETREDDVRFPILRAVGEETTPAAGQYHNVSMVFDDLWDTISDIGEVVGGVIGTGAAAIGTLGACTVGEVATLGADTLACVAAAGATVAGGVLTTDAVGNVINDVNT